MLPTMLCPLSIVHCPACNTHAHAYMHHTPRTLHTRAHTATAPCFTKAYVGWMDTRGSGLRYSLASGTLLGAMRTEPPGLLRWEHDVDIYMPARDAATLLHRLATDCPAVRKQSQGTGADKQEQTTWGSVHCETLELRGLVDHDGLPCCGFGFKLYHRANSACEMDILVLARSTAPFMHGETNLWPPWVRITLSLSASTALRRP